MEMVPGNPAIPLEDREDGLRIMRSMWEFAVVMHFFLLFSDALKIKSFFSEDLEEALLTPPDCGTLLVEIHVRLLRLLCPNRSPSYASIWFPKSFVCGYSDTENWEACLLDELNSREVEPILKDVACLEDFHLSDDSGESTSWNLELAACLPYFSAFSVRMKIHVLRLLCDWNECSAVIQEAARTIAIEKLRPSPLGQDSQHNTYWFFEGGTRLYRELVPPRRRGRKSRAELNTPPPWELVVKEESEWIEYVSSLESSRNKGEKELGQALLILLPDLHFVFLAKERAERRARQLALPRKRSCRLVQLEEQKKHRVIELEEEKKRQVEEQKRQLLELKRLMYLKRSEKECTPRPQPVDVSLVTDRETRLIQRQLARERSLQPQIENAVKVSDAVPEVKEPQVETPPMVKVPIVVKTSNLLQRSKATAHMKNRVRPLKSNPQVKNKKTGSKSLALSASQRRKRPQQRIPFRDTEDDFEPSADIVEEPPYVRYFPGDSRRSCRYIARHRLIDYGDQGRHKNTPSSDPHPSRRLDSDWLSSVPGLSPGPLPFQVTVPPHLLAPHTQNGRDFTESTLFLPMQSQDNRQRSICTSCPTFTAVSPRQHPSRSSSSRLPLDNINSDIISPPPRRSLSPPAEYVHEPPSILLPPKRVKLASQSSRVHVPWKTQLSPTQNLGSSEKLLGEKFATETQPSCSTESSVLSVPVSQSSLSSTSDIDEPSFINEKSVVSIGCLLCSSPSTAEVNPTQTRCQNLGSSISLSQLCSSQNSLPSVDVFRETSTEVQIPSWSTVSDKTGSNPNLGIGSADFSKSISSQRQGMDLPSSLAFIERSDMPLRIS